MSCVGLCAYHPRVFLQGFIFDIASGLTGMVVFIEHRYYGESLPFGEASFQDKEHLAYLTSEQALADFATLITSLKVTYTHSHTTGPY